MKKGKKLKDRNLRKRTEKISKQDMISVNVREHERKGNQHNKEYPIHEKEESRF